MRSIGSYPPPRSPGRYALTSLGPGHSPAGRASSSRYSTLLHRRTVRVLKDLPHKPVYIRSFAYGGGKAIGGQMDKYEDFTALFPKHIAPGLYRRAEMTPDDIDIAEIYDAFTFVLLAQVEGFGFCKEGEGGPFIAEGNIAPTGKVPMATHGGLLSEGYVHGFNNVAEAVDQLRGDCGERQIRGASTALCSGFGGNMGSAVVLRN